MADIESITYSYDDLVKVLKTMVAVSKETWKEWDSDNDSRVGKLLIALSGNAAGYRADIDGVHAVLAKAATASPDYIYDPSDWEATYHWSDRHLLVEGMDAGDVREFRTLYDGPSKWCAVVGIDPDEDGFVSYTEVRWFDNEADARAAVDITKGGDNG